MLDGEQIDIHKIIVNGGSQPRAALDDETIARYTEALANGAVFPPIVVFHDGECYWLADGFHRRKAELKLGRKTIAADIRQGTLRDAILYSVSANSGHGLPASNTDRRRAVLTLLNDSEWSQWSDREIARRCGVSPDTVGRLRRAGAGCSGFDRFENVTHLAHGKIEPRSILSDSDSIDRMFTHPKTGQPTTMRTANIGRSPSASEAEWDGLEKRLAEREASDDRHAADEWVECGDAGGAEQGTYDLQTKIDHILRALGGSRSDPLKLYLRWADARREAKEQGVAVSDFLYGQSEEEITDSIKERIAGAYPDIGDPEDIAAEERERILAKKAMEEAAYRAARPYGSFDETLSLFDRVGLALAKHPDRQPKHEPQVRRICQSVIENGFGLFP